MPWPPTWGLPRYVRYARDSGASTSSRAGGIRPGYRPRLPAGNGSVVVVELEQEPRHPGRTGGEVDGAEVERVGRAGLRLDAGRVRRFVVHDPVRAVRRQPQALAAAVQHDRVVVDEAVVPRTRRRRDDRAHGDPLVVAWVHPARMEFEPLRLDEPRVPAERDRHRRLGG